VVQKISLLEIISTAVLLANVVVVVADLSGVFHVVDSATLQVAHRCTHAPYGILAVLPTLLSRLRRFFAWERSVGCSQCCTAMMSWGHGRRQKKLLVIVLDINIERCCCWLLSETK